MSDAEWDDDNFEAPTGKQVVSDKWEGEDEDEEVRENWDDEDEKKEGTSADASAVQIKKKKPLKDRLAEKEDKRKKELEEKQKQEEEMKKLLTPKQLYEEKRRRQQLQEAADLAAALDAFISVKKEEPPSFGVIDGFDPKTKEEFDKFCQMLCDKITKFDKSPYYVPFMENLVRDLTLGVGAEDLKKVSSTLTALYNEKVKLQKGTKGKKKTKKTTLVVEKDGVTTEEGARFENDFEDYL